MPKADKIEALRQEIARRAYLRYCDRNCVPGGDFDDWLAAEREVLGSGESKPSSQGPSAVTPRRRRKGAR